MPLLHSKVVISRHYHQPQITVALYRDATTPGGPDRINLELTADDFLRAVATELGAARLVVTAAQFQARLARAAATVLERAKESAIHGLRP